MPIPHHIYFDGCGQCTDGHIAFVKALEATLNTPIHEHVNKITAISAGCFMALGIAFGLPSSKIAEWAQRIKDVPMVPSLQKLVATGGFVDGMSYVKHIILECEPRLATATFQELYEWTSVHVTIVVTDITEQPTHVKFDHIQTPHANVMRAVEASCSVPILFAPVCNLLPNRVMVDGGVLPSHRIIDEGEDFMFVHVQRDYATPISQPCMQDMSAYLSKCFMACCDHAWPQDDRYFVVPAVGVGLIAVVSSTDVEAVFQKQMSSLIYKQPNNLHL